MLHLNEKCILNVKWKWYLKVYMYKYIIFYLGAYIYNKFEAKFFHISCTILLYYKVLILRNATKNNNSPTFRWHLLNFCAPLLGYADSAQHTYHEYFYVRKWLWRARASWQAPDPWPGHARQTICPPASPKSTFRWCHTHSQYEKYVIHLFLLFS